MLKRWISVLLVAAGLVANTGWAADANAGKSAYGTCLACHGANGEGNKALNAPALAGQPAWYIQRQLENFRSGVRGAGSGDAFGPQMRPMAQILADDAAVANVAAYSATFPAKKHAATLGGDAGKGKALYGTCVACHGANGEGNKVLNAPPLAGLQDWYVARQLKNFKSGARGGDSKDIFGAQMRPMAMTLADDQAINDVSAYIATLGQ